MVPEPVEGPNKLDNFKLIKFTAQQSKLKLCLSAPLPDKINKTTSQKQQRNSLRLCGFA